MMVSENEKRLRCLRFASDSAKALSLLLLKTGGGAGFGAGGPLPIMFFKFADWYAVDVITVFLKADVRDVGVWL